MFSRGEKLIIEETMDVQWCDKRRFQPRPKPSYFHLALYVTPCCGRPGKPRPVRTWRNGYNPSAGDRQS